ncbi:MAG: hypothetical protein PUA48_07110 [Christensenellaceae bacterium]|nr:hypothetical protein [Christensenellaceae bacterium]
MRFDPEKIITLDFEIRLKKYRRLRSFFIACLPLGFLMFGGGVPLIFVTGKTYLAFIPALGFLAIPGSAIAAAALTQKIYKMQSVKDILTAIKAQDVAYLYQLGAGFTESQTFLIVQRLITTGLLDGYELVGNFAVARSEKYVNKDAVMREYMALRFGRTDSDGASSDGGGAVEFKECYYCHEKLPKDAVYCTKCGAKQGF